jgi:hypothetical protein
VLKASCRGSGISFTLNEPAQGSLRVSLHVGASTGSLKLCAKFGGTIAMDRPSAAGIRGLFRATHSFPPDACEG